MAGVSAATGAGLTDRVPSSMAMAGMVCLRFFHFSPCPLYLHIFIL